MASGLVFNSVRLHHTQSDSLLQRVGGMSFTALQLRIGDAGGFL